MDKDNHSPIIGIEEIKKIIPHRYPFLLVDRVLEIRHDFIRAIKNVSVNEPFFQGHFPNESIMPGVLQIEAMAQLAAIFRLSSLKDRQNRQISVYFLTIDKAKFRKKVIPGDTLSLEICILKDTGSKMIFAGKTTVNGVIASEAEMMAMIQENKLSTFNQKTTNRQ